MEGAPHLVVLRGNSASGKSTIAAMLQRELGPGTANVGQDHLRRVVLREHDVPDGDNIGLLEHTVRYCSGMGYNVIVEGILLAAHYRAMLCRLIAEHQGPAHVYYLEVPVEEALRRHRMRPLAAEVSAALIRDWYVPSDTLGLPGETVLDGTAKLVDTVSTIRGAITGATTGRFASERFL